MTVTIKIDKNGRQIGNSSNFIPLTFTKNGKLVPVIGKQFTNRLGKHKVQCTERVVFMK